MVEYLKNNISKEEAIEKIKMESRRYAKRQITWFKQVENIIWLDGQAEAKNNIMKIEEYLK